jgi:chloramphenicol 3-O phosphotransferase
MPTAIVLHGPTSSGKTSLAKELQKTAPVPAFHVSLDAFVTMSNRADMRNDAERDKVYGLHCENFRATLSRLVQTSFDVVADLVLRDEAELEACLAVLRVRPTCVVGVQAPLAVLEARERLRNDRGAGMAREQFGHPAYNRHYDLTVDTSICSPQAGASRIRQFIEGGAE